MSVVAVNNPTCSAMSAINDAIASVIVNGGTYIFLLFLLSNVFAPYCVAVPLRVAQTLLFLFLSFPGYDYLSHREVLIDMNI